MVRIKPFEAIRPVPHLAARVASVPYDVVNTEEARALAEGRPYSFLHVVRPEIDFPPGTDPYSDPVYAKARENFDRLLADEVLVRDREPGMFLYRQVMNHNSQVGLVCCCHIDDYLNNRIRKHEKTRPDKEDDRTRHVMSINANAGPVFLTYRDQRSIDTLVARDMNSRPLYHFVAHDGVTHTAWRVPNPSQYAEAFASIEHIYVADGHHRSASAARAGAQRRGENPNHTGEEEYNWFLSVLFPADQLNILPYNRVLLDTNGLGDEQVLQALRGVGTLAQTTEAQPDRAGVFCFYLRGGWHRLEIDPATIDRDDPIASLDVSILQDRVLEPIFGINDPRTDKRIDFVGGIRGARELKQRVDSGEAAIGISMYPTGIDELLAVSDADLIMPPKSTWFEPKLRSGLFVHSLD